MLWYFAAYLRWSVSVIVGMGVIGWERTKQDRRFERLETIEVYVEEDPFEEINDPYLQIQLEQAWI